MRGTRKNEKLINISLETLASAKICYSLQTVSSLGSIYLLPSADPSTAVSVHHPSC